MWTFIEAFPLSYIQLYCWRVHDTRSAQFFPKWCGNTREWIRGCDGNFDCAYNPTNGTKSKGDLWFVIAADVAFAQIEYYPLKTF